MYRQLSESDPAPLHPGEVLRVDILPCLSMTPADLAAHLAVPRAVIESLLAEKNGITPDLARRLGIAFGQGAHHWLALQLQHDLWQAARSDPDGVRPLTWSRRVRRERLNAPTEAAA